MSRKKWEIPILGRRTRFSAGARRILAWRLEEVLHWTGSFSRNGDEESIHQLRIAIRRLRYPLETLVSRIPRKPALRFMEALGELQDAAGRARDLDVMTAHLRHMGAEHGWELRDAVFTDLETMRTEAYAAVHLALECFLAGEPLARAHRMFATDRYRDEIEAVRKAAPPAPMEP